MELKLASKPVNASMKVYSIQNKGNNKEMSLLEIVESWKIGDCGKEAVIFNSDYIYMRRISVRLHKDGFLDRYVIQVLEAHPAVLLGMVFW